VSIPVTLDQLRGQTERFGPVAYLLTVTDDSRPHAVAVVQRWQDGRIVVDAGRHTRANVAERPAVSLLWPPVDRAGHTLIVDGTGQVNGGDDPTVVITPTRAVLHVPRSSGLVQG
jgi:hypothetical protein